MYFKIETQRFKAAFIIFPRILGNIFNTWVYPSSKTKKMSLLYTLECYWLQRFCVFTGDVIEGFEELVDTIKVLYDDVAVDILQYFEDTYIGRY